MMGKWDFDELQTAASTTFEHLLINGESDSAIVVVARSGGVG